MARGRRFRYTKIRSNPRHRGPRPVWGLSLVATDLQAMMYSPPVAEFPSLWAMRHAIVLRGRKSREDALRQLFPLSAQLADETGWPVGTCHTVLSAGYSVDSARKVLELCKHPCMPDPQELVWVLRQRFEPGKVRP